MNKVAIYILTMNRLEFAKVAIQSALNNNFVDVIVSDCSNNNDLINYISDFTIPENSNLIYKFRNEKIEQFKHISKVINENQYKFFTIFHDDDILYPSYVNTLLNIHLTSNYIAVGCDYNLINDAGKRLKINSLFIYNGITSVELILKSYCRIGFIRHPCFSSYMYNSELLKGLSPNISDGGTWSDFAFIIKLAKQGNIYWHNKKLMDYRIHGSNISSNERILDRIKITNFIMKSCNLNKYSSIIMQYKLKYILKFRNKRNFDLIILKFFILTVCKSPFIIVKIIYTFICKKLYAQNWIS
jgi:hypothetical protein